MQAIFHIVIVGGPGRRGTGESANARIGLGVENQDRERLGEMPALSGEQKTRLHVLTRGNLHREETRCAGS